MRFTTEHAHAILQGSKREHRVRPRTKPYRVGDRLTIQRPKHVDEMTPLERVRYEEGDGHRGHKSIGHLLVTSTHLAQLGELTIVQARAEGFRDRAGFARAWMGFPAGDASSDEDVLELFEAHHASVWVVVLGVEADLRDVPRYLGATSPLVEGGKARVMSAKKVKPGKATAPNRTFSDDEATGYVTSAVRGLPGEQEPVDSITQEQITKRAELAPGHWQAVEKGNRERDLRLLGIEERMMAARRLARSRNVDIERELWMVEKLRAQGRSDEAVVHKLRGVEDKINRPEAA